MTSTKLKMMISKIKEIEKLYQDFLTIRKVIPDIIKTLTSVVIAVESNRLLLESLINDLENDKITLKEKSNDENWIN